MKKKASASGFHKFINPEKKGAAKREEFRQEKRKWKKELTAKAEERKKKVIEKARPTIQREEKHEQMPLNKYLAHSGVCSRRDAADVVRNGKVKVNGEVIMEPGHKVSTKDTVTFDGKKLHPVKNLVYILMNKPKDYLTTTEDPQQRRTVLDLLKGATETRIYPVGRLDRNTSGVLLLTNDGDLSQKLTHPSNEIKKVYAVTLDKPLTKNDFDAILKGVPLEDGIANVDVLAFTDNADKTQVGVEIHTGRNRIVRRIFEHFGYDVKNLDRVMFAGLTKKNVPRGKWRFLSEKEVRDLKFFKKGTK
jgi:23S rRNA pseudouridine2605 synthase